MDFAHLHKAKAELRAGQALQDKALMNAAGAEMVEHLINAAQEMMEHIQQVSTRIAEAHRIAGAK